MKRFRLWAVWAVVALFLTVFSAGTTYAVADETKSNVVITDEDGAKNGSEPINLNNVTAKELVVESGNNGVLRINGGNIDTLSVVAPKLEKIGFAEIVKLLEMGMDAADVAEMYRDSLAEQKAANATQPTVSFVGDAAVEEVVVSAGAVLNLAGGDVKEIVIKGDENPDMLTITIRNYNGKITVDQKKNSQGIGDLLTVKLENSNPSVFDVVGEANCSVYVEGDKESSLATVNVKGSSNLTLSVDAKDLVVAEGAKNPSVRLYSDVENILVTADNSKVYLAISGKVENAKVDGDNVKFTYTGTVKNKEINGKGSKIEFTSQVVVTPEPTEVPKAPEPTKAPEKPEGTVIGNEDCTSGFWGAHSNTYKVEEGESKTITLWNYTKELNNWNNYYVVLQNIPDAHGVADNADYKEYAVVRSDNWGWGWVNGVWTDPIAGDNNASTDWATWLSNMNGAKVEVTVTNNGGSADVLANITTESGKEYYQKYTNITVDGDLYFCFTVDNCYLIVDEPEADEPTTDEPTTDEPTTDEPTTDEPTTDEPEAEYEIPAGTVIGYEDCTTPWWTEFSEGVKVKAGESKTVTFKNYTAGTANFQNFLVVLKNVPGAWTADNGYKEYVVARADWHGWGMYGGVWNDSLPAEAKEANWVWETFTKDMNGATVNLTITNSGTEAEILAEVTTVEGKEYFQKYKGINVEGDIYYCLTVEGGYLVIE